MKMIILDFVTCPVCREGTLKLTFPDNKDRGCNQCDFVIKDEDIDRWHSARLFLNVLKLRGLEHMEKKKEQLQ